MLIFSGNTVKWTAPEGQNIVKVINKSPSRFAIKIKSSDVETYTTCPVYDIIEADHTLNLVVVRKKAPMKDDKISISYLECEADDTDAAAVFKKPNLTPNVYIVTMKCITTSTER
ncbi:unnamed protein product [Caenorhabditis auriculariae]|uniref:MSP domain-containing protein n=1 Tax=Caenorhabditis auriculariae TaxID=2777116 RepID=A0A8S1HJP9_9PELO|nr:unnamed protein product [Caenorhabditis auriculariae]